MQRRSFLANVDPATISFNDIKNRLEKKISNINSYMHHDYVENPNNTQNRPTRQNRNLPIDQSNTSLQEDTNSTQHQPRSRMPETSSSREKNGVTDNSPMLQTENASQRQRESNNPRREKHSREDSLKPSNRENTASDNQERFISAREENKESRPQRENRVSEDNNRNATSREVNNLGASEAKTYSFPNSSTLKRVDYKNNEPLTEAFPLSPRRISPNDNSANSMRKLGPSTNANKNTFSTPANETLIVDKMPQIPAENSFIPAIETKIFKAPSEEVLKSYNMPQSQPDFDNRQELANISHLENLRNNEHNQHGFRREERQHFSERMPSEKQHFPNANNFPDKFKHREMPKNMSLFRKEQQDQSHFYEINDKLERIELENKALKKQLFNYSSKEEDRITEITDKIDEVADNTIDNHSNLSNIKHKLDKLTKENDSLKKQIKVYNHIEEEKIDNLDKKVNKVMYSTYGANENLHEITYKLNKLVGENESLKRQISNYIDNEEVNSQQIANKISKVANGTYNNQSNLYDINNSLDYLREENKSLEKRIYSTANNLGTEIKENTQATLDADNKIQNILFKIDRMKEENKYLKEIISDNYKSLKDDMQNIHSEKNYQLEQYLKKQHDSLKEEIKELSSNKYFKGNYPSESKDSKNDYQSIIKEMLQYKMVSMLLNETRNEPHNIKYIENTENNNKQDSTLNTLNVLEKVKSLSGSSSDNIMPEVLNELKKSNQLTTEKFENICKLMSENVKEMVTRNYDNSQHMAGNSYGYQQNHQEKEDYYNKIENILNEIKSSQDHINKLLDNQNSNSQDKNLFVEDIHRLLKEINDRNKVLTSIYERERRRPHTRNINENLPSSFEDEEKKNNYR